MNKFITPFLAIFGFVSVMTVYAGADAELTDDLEANCQVKMNEYGESAVANREEFVAKVSKLISEHEILDVDFWANFKYFDKSLSWANFALKFYNDEYKELTKLYHLIPGSDVDFSVLTMSISKGLIVTEEKFNEGIENPKGFLDEYHSDLLAALMLCKEYAGGKTLGVLFEQVRAGVTAEIEEKPEVAGDGDMVAENKEVEEEVILDASGPVGHADLI